MNAYFYNFDKELGVYMKILWRAENVFPHASKDLKSVDWSTEDGNV